MTLPSSPEKELWSITAEMLSSRRANWCDHWSFNFRNDPKRLAFVLARYKFCAKMARHQKTILELGCSSGIGAPILAEHAEKYTGIDLDQQAIETAQYNFSSPRFHFIYDDFMGKVFGRFNAVFSLDVIEHILPEYEKEYLETICANLDDDGICVVGTPNITSSPYASEYSKIGHVNMYSQERLVTSLKRYFHQVLPFGMNDETLHTGYAPMCHYLLSLCCHRKN
jgi:2-polyprenyl-3-methyl-5-hydroxy-6-metoxy-1,4-benzoquinol methylase